MDSNMIIALTEMVKNLGYKDHAKLANKISYILKSKEDFEKRFVVDDREYDHGRVEKTMVKKEAETLVDNLIILTQYTYLFGRDGSSYAPYRELLKGVDKKSFSLKVQQKRRTLQDDMIRTQNSLKDLPIFYKSIINHAQVDITTQSLREMMQKVVGNNEMLDLQDTHELANWNAIIELNEKLESEGESSFIYQLLGENFYEMGDYDRSLTALERSIELEHTNGTSWAIKSLILFTVLQKNKCEYREALARTEYSGYINNPITSEEYWINERVEFTYNDLEEVKAQFVNSAINALLNWPAHQVDGCTKGKPNYCYNLNNLSQCKIDLEREFLFISLNNEITYEDFDINKNKVIEIFRSFQRWNIEIYPLTSIFYNVRNRDKANIFKLLSFINEDELKVGFNEYFKAQRFSHYTADEDLSLLKSNIVSYLYCKHIGKKQFFNLSNSLLRLFTTHQEISNLNQVSAVHLGEVNFELKGLKKKLNVDFNFGNRPPEYCKADADLSEFEITASLNRAHKKSNGWNELLESSAWKDNSLSQDIGVHFYGLVMLSILLELIHQKRIEDNVILLEELCQSENCLKSALSDMPTYFYCGLINYINSDIMKIDIQNRLTVALEVIYEQREILDEEEAQDSLLY
ncbi:hypothetical protein [Alteromonas lipolytica]|uniref:Uncharacterized protein n=1 Tax=Alteromonas lipolytica TaxID=1856405 RepID=A0A1E8FDS9_9ALTE|nr:hypothetical protein [Alteromonas lipolytica]OFI33916.1 hypothetical protein BFC17_20340 [Alteromonas lipolytica]GGF67311.1 hypothetical protein GCM10011338_19310 [Alteromonas lipolytica]